MQQYIFREDAILFYEFLAHFHESSNATWRKEKHKRWASETEWIERERETADERHDAMSRFVFSSHDSFSLPLFLFRSYSCSPWRCSCKNNLEFLFEFYDLNRILRDMLPSLPRSRRRAIESAVDFMLYFYDFTCGSPPCPRKPLRPQYAADQFYIIPSS